MSIYYSFSKICSFNSTYNFTVGGRGVGKTYGWQKMVIAKAIKTYEANPDNVDLFIYLRRYKDELAMARNTFFAAVEVEFPDWDFRNNGFRAQMSPANKRDDKKRKWIDIGYFIELSRGQSYKSVAFPKVKDIGFDEFILEKGLTRYLPNEYHVFLNFYSTVNRNRNANSEKARVFFMANSVSITNPYFLELGINPNNADKNGFVKLAKSPITNRHYVCVHFIDSEEYADEVYETEFGAFIRGTDYAKFAVENQFSDNHDGLIQDKTSRARYMFTLETNGGTFSIWMDFLTAEYYCQRKRPKGDETIITLIPDKMSEEKTLMRNNDSAISRLRTGYNHGRVWFDSAFTRNAFLEIYKG